MPISELELNLSAFSSIEAPTFNLTNQTMSEFLNSIPVVANDITYGYFGIIIMFFSVLVLWWVLSEKTQFGKFQYPNMKGLTIALGLTCVMSANSLASGFFVNFIHFVWFNSLYLIFFIWHVIAKN